MNRKTVTAQLIAIVLFMVPIIDSFPVSAFDVVTIVGVVNGTSQIVADEEIYEVDDTPQGNDLVKNYIGQKVKVTGKLRIEGDMRILDVTKFEVVKELL
jgi:hypothetical protein